MFEWLFGKKDKNLEEKIDKSFSSVKKDMDVVGKWIKHLNAKDKQLFDVLNELKSELSSVNDELEGLRAGMALLEEDQKNKQVLENEPVLDKQTGVLDVEEPVQTPVQTANFYDIFKGLSSNERALIFTLMNSDLKLSYEDLAMILGKERSTIRGQINSIKQKSEGLVEEIVEKNGKKRVYIPLEIKEKMAKYAKVRVSNGKKVRVNSKNKENNEENS